MDKLRRQKLVFNENSLLRDLKMETSAPKLPTKPVKPNKPVPPRKEGVKKEILKKNAAVKMNKFKGMVSHEKVYVPPVKVETETFVEEDIIKWMRNNYKHGKQYNFTQYFPLPVTFFLFRYLNQKDISSLSMTCKYWNKRVNQWKGFLILFFFCLIFV